VNYGIDFIIFLPDFEKQILYLPNINKKAEPDLVLLDHAA
jgi:hypothetical protein